MLSVSLTPEASPFQGHGLSYTTYKYSQLRLNASTIGPCDAVGVTVTVRNTGGRDGAEVVQVYAKQPEASVPVPRVRLVAFERVSIAAGATATVKLSVEPETHAAVLDNDSDDDIYDGREAVVVEKGVVQIFVGGGQPDFAQRMGQPAPLAANVTVSSQATVASCGL